MFLPFQGFFLEGEELEATSFALLSPSKHKLSHESNHLILEKTENLKGALRFVLVLGHTAELENSFNNSLLRTYYVQSPGKRKQMWQRTVPDLRGERSGDWPVGLRGAHR